MNLGVRFIGQPWPNHSVHSGYHQVSSYLGSEVPMPDISSFWNTLMPGRVAVKMAERSGVAHYGYRAFYHEWAAAREMPGIKQNTVYHLLYGDQSFRYLGRMRLSRKARVVATFHIPPTRLQEELRRADHLRTLDAVILVGSNQAPFFGRAVEQEKIYVVPHGIDTETFRPGDVRSRAPGSARRCLFVGMHERDFDTLAAVIDILGDCGEAIVFDVVSADDVQAMLDAKKNVTFYSGVSEEKLVKLYQLADVLVQPLLDCTANNAILEGLACGVPVVASDVGGVRDYLSEKCAILAPAGDAQKMAQTILELLKDDERLLAMGANAREQAKEFAWAKIAARLQRIYEGLFERRVRPQ